MIGQLLCGVLATTSPDIASLWDFSDPAGSERRFRQALSTSTGDDALVLQTQIARTWGIRKDFDKARTLLAQIEAEAKVAGPAAKARWELEMGRTFASASHPPASQTPQAKSRARGHFEASLALARQGKLDGLAIDAIHMMAFLDTAPADQERWARDALALVLASDQPAAKAWEGSVRNNLGYALHQQGRLGEALAEFEKVVAIRERGTNAVATRTARWMVAWTLRAMGRTNEAIAIQLRLEREGDADGKPDPYVFEELALLYRSTGDETKAAHYANRKAGSR